MPDLDGTTELVRVLADPTRIRLLSLLAGAELSVAEIVLVLGIAQSRASTHLGALRDAGMVRSRRDGSSTLHVLDPAMPSPARRMWDAVAATVDDAVIAADRDRASRIVAQRGDAGDRGGPARLYSPGRTWESATKAVIGLVRLGDVLDVASGEGALAGLLAVRADSVTCLDRAPDVVAAGARRWADRPNLRFVEGDMHALPFQAEFDAVLLLSALELAADPERALREAARVLRPGGTLVLSTLESHPHVAVAAAWDHVQTGFRAEILAEWLRGAGLHVESCGVTSVEQRPPRFAVITAVARKR